MYSRKSILYPAAFSIKRYLNTKEEPRDVACIAKTNVTVSSLCTIRTCKALSYSRPRYETKKTKENPILHCHGQYHRKDTFTLHRHRERIALNGTTRMASSARQRDDARRLVHRLTDSHCSLVTWPRISPLSWSIRLRYYRVPRFETIQTSGARQTNREPCRWIRRATGQKRREEKRQGERGLRGVAALVGTRLGVGSFVSWTLLLARINLLPPPLASLSPTSPCGGPFLGHPPLAREKGGLGRPRLGLLAAAARCYETPERRPAHADSANHPHRPLRSY